MDGSRPEDPRLTDRSAVNTFRESLRLLGTRRFGTFWFASLLSNLGTWAQQVAEPWLLLTLGASSFVIGLDSFATNAPVLLLTLAGGVLADRSDRRRVITGFQSVQMLCPTAIVVLLMRHAIQPWMVIALAVVVGVTDALSVPSFQSIVPSIVREEQIGTGLALNATQFNLSRILGPSLAGVLMSAVGATACFVASAVSYVPFVGVALWILPRRTPRPPESLAPPRGHILAGIREIARDGAARGALLTVLTTSLLCTPLMTFAPVLVRDVFHGGAGQFSAAITSFGAGGLLGASGLLAIPATVDRGRLSDAFAFAYAVALILTALSPWFWAMLPLLMIAGAAMTVSNTAANTLLQARAAPHLLGRTVSIYMLAMRGGVSIGALGTGAAVGLVGVRHALLANGLLAVAGQFAISQRWRKTMR